jgi:hypothetical protein
MLVFSVTSQSKTFELLITLYYKKLLLKKMILVSLVLFTGHIQAQQSDTVKDKTSFQVAAPWRPEYDIRSDVAIVYGIDKNFEQRVQSYKERGYTIQFMTGIAWGEYQDYFTGKFDGKTHYEDGQVDKNGDVIWHGKDVPYVAPSAPYLAYIKSLIKRAIDAGVTAIYLEEPEYWARAGYSESFKKEWQQYYGSPWIPQHTSPEATYLSSKLKYLLYFNALKEVFAYAKEYSESKGTRVKCYVPTHSLLNYSSWRIVSPEASLAVLPGMDGYIAQVWTGTARERNYFNGVQKERVFENAFLEYGSMLSMTAPTGRKIYFLTDPIEDWPRTWDDYKRNYQATFTAQLMYPSVNNYEVMPWPNRIYLGKFKLENNNTPQPMSPAYATQVQVMINSLNDMPASSTAVSGSKGIGVLLANSMMFQRFPTHNNYEDPQLSNFYGMVLPLLKRGIPVETVHIENLGFKQSLENIKVLIMSYANMKPLAPEVHQQLAGWVKKGGVLIYYGRDNDPFQQVKEWWNSNGNRYSAPSVHLFEQMNIHPIEGKTQYPFGKGEVYIIRQDPKELVMQPGQDEALLQGVRQAYEQKARAGRLETKNNFYVERGPYIIAAVMDESVNNQPLQLNGSFIDLFDPALPVVSKKEVKPGQQAYLYNLRYSKDKTHPLVLAAASRVYNETTGKRTWSFLTKSPSGTNNVMRILLPAKPVQVSVLKDGKPWAVESSWDQASHTCLLKFINDCDGINVSISW